jgi:hypothetical protein
MTTQFDALPSSLRARAQLEQFGSVPVLLARPEPASDPPPLLVWLHGRTANKELEAASQSAPWTCLATAIGAI